jgi:DNA-binding response OmpR family regulator
MRVSPKWLNGSAVQDNSLVIIRQDGHSQQFITQPDHAELAAHIMRRWRGNALDRHPRRDAILLAVAEHDNGWIEEDTSTLVDAAGRPLDFISAPPEVKHRIWPRAVSRLGHRHPYEAALIAQHALTVHAQHRADGSWRPFFDAMERLRTTMLGEPAGDAFERDYHFVRTGDLLSLVFCNGGRIRTFPWRRSHDTQGATLEISPDPFAGARPVACRGTNAAAASLSVSCGATFGARRGARRTGRGFCRRRVGLTLVDRGRRPALEPLYSDSPMPRILIVEDDPDIRDLISLYLRKAGHSVDTLSQGGAVVPRLRSEPADLIVLDLMLPGMGGLEICQALRNDPATARLPVIMLTARSDESDRVAGLELGADDYVTKPFSPKELVARVAALLRRVSGAESPTTVMRYGDIAVDSAQHVVLDGSREVRLTAKEFLLLEYLIRHRGRVLSRDLLLTDVWGYNYTGGTRTVDVHIRRLREKLPVLNAAIETIKQFGYKLT